MRIHQHSMIREALAPGLIATLLSIGLGGCGSDDGAPPAAPVATSLADAPLTTESIAARQHYFGVDNIDSTSGAVRADLVVVAWLSNTTYAMAINGKVVLLDASLLRREAVAGRTPTTLGEMIALRPSYIFVSKAAAGHADLAANIAVKTGATVVGAQEHCDAIQVDATRQFAGSSAIPCSAVLPKAEAIGVAIHTVALGKLGVCLRAVKNIDTSAVAADPALAPASFNWSVGSDMRDPIYWPVGLAATDGVSTSGDAGSPSVLYQFTVTGPRSFTLTWNGTAGPLKELAPGVAVLLRQLPKTDVQIGSVDTENTAANGLRDPALYIQAVAPKIFYPAGHDAAAQRHGAFSNAEYAKRALQSSLGSLGITASSLPVIRFVEDTRDYSLAPVMTFDPAAPAWNLASDRVANASCS